MPNCRHGLLLLLLSLVLSGCATVPDGPSVLVLPGQGKSFDQFQAEDLFCRQWATQQTGVTPSEAANQETMKGAAVGTLLGAGLGAAIGAAAGDPALGAAIGAGSGLLGGTLVGADEGEASAAAAQNRFDIAYQQCMYAKGNRVQDLEDDDD
jgi:uncharacterized protein YcfJ